MARAANGIDQQVITLTVGSSGKIGGSNNNANEEKKSLQNVNHQNNVDGDGDRDGGAAHLMGSSMGDTVRGAAGEESATNLAQLTNLVIKNGEDFEIKQNQNELVTKQTVGPAPIPHSEMYSQETSGAATITNTPGVPQIT